MMTIWENSYDEKIHTISPCLEKKKKKIESQTQKGTKNQEM